MHPVTPREPPTTLAPEDAAALERMRTLTPLADPTALLPDVPPARIPRHIAVIMDGNGRWAAERGFPRAFGHRMGARATRALLDAAERIGIEALTLYSFSAENWKRPADEIEQLMLLYVAYMDGERDALVRRNIRFRQIGRREGLPQDALDALDRTLDATASCTGPTLCLAINYSARQELADAAQRLAERASAGTLDPRDITEDTLERELDTAGLPDPDLLVRTAGELRLSNFLLWQLSYAELYVTNTLWPDFDAGSLHTAVRAFASRQRRYGGLDTEPATGVTDHHDPPSYNGTQ